LTLGVVNSAGGVGLTKTGTGTLILGTDNAATLLGPITIAGGGVVKWGTGTGALGSTGANTTVLAGAVLDLNGQTTPEPLDLRGTGLTNLGAARSTLGALINTAAGAAAVTGNVALGAAASVGSDYLNALSGGTAGGNITLSGVVSGGNALTKVGNNTLTLTGANTFSGLTLALGNVVVSGASGAVGTGGNTTINPGPVSAGLPVTTLTYDNSGAAFSTRTGLWCWVVAGLCCRGMRRRR
jgi:autotransporter-associated beta strand protein